MRKPWALISGIGAFAALIIALVAASGLLRDGEASVGAAGTQAATTQAATQDAAEAGAQAAPGVQPTGTSLVQPIAFPHDLHTFDFQIDCQYCHFSAERSVDAGLPGVDVCMGCHTAGRIDGRTNPAEVEKIREYAAAGEPIPWVRIYKISDHAHFPHMRHVNAGLDCTQCHGPVPEMGAIESRDPAWGGANMGWCVTCHVDLGVRRDCTVCHY